MNEFAISSGGVGDALLNSASALAAAGNNIDEAIGLITAANTVVQDPSKVGTTLKTISMFLRASKTDAEAAGESTEGMAESVSKLRTEILQLTGGRVDIQLDANTYKNTTEILRELSQVWDSLSDITQANILERIGGKRNANVTAALLENFEIVDKVITATSNSTGSALAENEKYLDSINGKIAQFQATFQDLSQSILSSELIKLVVDLGTLGLSAIDGIADGLGSVVGFVDKLIPGLKIIAPLFAAKKIGQKFDIFDSIKDFAQNGFGKVGNFFGGLVDAAEDSTHTISGIFKGLFKKLSWKNLSGFGKFSAIALGISAVVAGFDYLSKAAERSRKKLEEINAEYNENKEQLDALNLELETTRLRMYELLNADTLTYVEVDELERLKETNLELEKEIELLKTRNKFLGDDKVNEFLKTSKNTFDNGFTAFSGLSFEEIAESTINRLFNMNSSTANSGYNMSDGLDYTDVVAERLTWYKSKFDEYQKAKEDYYNASEESDREHFKKAMELAKENYGEAESYLSSTIATLQSDLDSISDYYDYGSDPVVDKAIDRYNKWIDKIKIGLGYNGAEEDAFISRINKSVSAEKISSVAEDVVSIYEDVLSQIDENGVNLSKNVFGNIDLNNRKVLEWNKENIKTYSDALKSWGLNPDDISGEISTVLGSSGKYNGVEIAFSPLLQTENGAVLLNSSTVDKYIFGLIDEAKKNDGKFTTEELFSLDSSGLKIDGIEIKNLLADIGDTAINTAENMHYIGEQGAFKLAYNDLIDELGKEGSIGILTELGRSGEVTLDMLKNICDFSDDTTNELESFIDELIDIGYISDRTDDDLRKVANAFNKLGEEANGSVDEIDDAFKRWEDAQNEVQSGVQFDALIDAINHVHDTVSDRTSDIYGKVGNSDYKAAIDLIIPVDAKVDKKSLIETSKYIKDNIKKYFTFDDDGNYKGLNVNKFLSESAKAGIMEFDKNSGLYKILNGVSIEKWADELNVAIPLVKAFIGELNEYGADIQILELDDDLESLAKNAKSALASLKESFDDLDIDLDLTGKTNEEKIEYLNSLINELTARRKAEGIDATSYNNLTKVMEHCIKQKQILEQPSVMYVDTTQITDEKTVAQIEKIQNFINAYHEFELLCQIGFDEKEAEETLQKRIFELGEDSELSTKFEIDTTSALTVADQLYSQVNKVVDGFKLPKDVFQSAVDATATMANNINEIFNGKRDLVFNISEIKDGKIRISVDSQELENVEEKKEEVSKPTKIPLSLTNPAKAAVNALESLYYTLDKITSKKHKVDVTVNTSVNDSGLTSGSSNGNSNPIKDWWNGIWGKKSEVGGTAHARGNWGYDGGEALVGELGQELVVDPKTSSWYTVGDHGAEFANIPKDAIIFNHKQTKGLLKDGHIFGRGKAYSGGLNTNITLTGNKYLDGLSTPQLTLQTPQAVVNVTNNATNNKSGLVNLGDALKYAGAKKEDAKSDNNGNGSSNNSVAGAAAPVNPSQKVNGSSGSGGSSGSDDSKQTIDYVEIRLDRLARSLEEASEAADATSRSFKDRSKSIDEEISATKKLITANSKAATTYKNKADSVKLSSSLKEKVRNGDYKITDYDSETADLINQYKEYYEKYLDATSEVTRQKLSKAELQMEKFALTQQKYDSKYELQDAKTSLYESKDEKAQLEGKGGSITAQNELIDIQERRKKLLKEEQKELEALANSGSIKKGTQDWYDLQTAIVEVKADIIDVDNEISKLEQRKVEIRYEKFENIKDDYEDKLTLKGNRIEYYEAKNEEAELAGKGGSINAQKKIIELHKDRLSLLEKERKDLRKQLKLIPEGTDEWYDAKAAIQEINTEIANTNNEITKANDNINAINLERFKNVADEFAPEHSETSARIAYYEDSNTKHELSGNHGSIYAQDKMIEWNAEYINDLKDEEAEMRKRLKDIDKDSPEYDEAMSDLRDHLDKIRDAENKQLEYENNKRQILFARYQDIQTLYDSKMSNLDHKVSKINHEITMLETNGYKVTKSYYEDQKAIEEKRLSVLQKEYNELKEAFDEAMDTGEIKKYSQEWYDYQLIMNGVEQSINETEESMASLDKTMRDLDWENFNYMRDTISELNDEADFYIELMSDKDLYDDKGNITEHGMATMGLYAQKYNTYLEEAAVYQKELAKIEAELANDPNNTELIDRKRELTEAMRDNIIAAKDEKQAMVDLVEDGINYELDALSELIDEYKTALDRAKDLHDYEKKVADSTSEISSIKKQISAYQGDDSQEAKLKIQKLQNDLKEAEENLEETEYERYISDQKELLDEFYNEYETNLNARLDNVDVLLNTVITSINTNSGGINETLNGLAADFGVKLSGELQNIWGNSTFEEVVRSYVGEDSTIIKDQTAVLSTLRGIEDKVTRIINNTPTTSSNNTTGSTTGSQNQNTNNSITSKPTTSGSAVSGGSTTGTSSSSTTGTTSGSLNTSGSSSQSSNAYSNGDIIGFNNQNFKSYANINDDNYVLRRGDTDSKYKVIAVNGKWVGISLYNDAFKELERTHGKVVNPAYWVDSTKYNITKYKNGGVVDYTGLAWVDGTKSNPEYMLNAEDTANLMKLTEDLRKLYSLRANIAGVAKEASGAIKSGLLDTGKISDISKAGAKSGNSIGDINITIPIERVQDYNDFVTQLKDDPKFDKFIKSVSVDLLDGKSRLAKNKFNWNK